MSGPGLDLDAIENPDDPGPYPVTISGRVYATVGPTDMDYRELLQVVVDLQNDKVIEVLHRVIAKDDREAFWANELPIFKMKALVVGYMVHYNLPSAPEAGASPPSSEGTAGPSKQTSPSAA